MAKKKKSGKQAPVLSLSFEDQRLLSRLLDEVDRSAPQALVKQIPSPTVAEKLVEALPLHDPATPERLAAIRLAFPQKAVHKAVKRTLFKLKQKGISTPPMEPEEGPSFSFSGEEPSAYVGPIDGAGNRPVLLVIPQRVSGVDLAMGVVGDKSGIIDFVYDRYGRKKAKEIREGFFSKIPYMVETTLIHAAAVLERAYALEKENPGHGAGEYIRLRPWLLQKAEDLDSHALSDSLPFGPVSPAVLTESQIQKLLRHKLMASWALDPETLGTLMEEISKVEESPIFISETQRREHIGKIKEEGLAKIFGDRELENLRNRLEETAYVFFKIGEEAFARLCVAAASSLDVKDPFLKINPLLNALVDRTLAQRPKPGRSSPLILP